MKTIRIILSEEEYASLIMFINRNYLIDAKNLLNELNSKGNVKIE